MMPSDAADRHDAALSKLKGCLYAAHGLYLVVAGAALAVFCWLIPALLVKVLDSGVVDPGEVPEIARRLVEQRRLAPLLALPAIVLGAVAMFKVPWRLLWVTLGLAALIAPGALLIYTFVVTVGLLYRAPAL